VADGADGGVRELDQRRGAGFEHEAPTTAAAERVDQLLHLVCGPQQRPFFALNGP
jgi:hypothetical protein